MTNGGDLRKLLKRFKENYGNSELIINDRIRKEYNDILIEFGY